MPLETPGLGSQEPSGQGLGLGTTSHSSAAPATPCLPRVGWGWGWGLDQGQCKGSGLGSFIMPGGCCFIVGYSLLCLHLLAFVSKLLHQNHGARTLNPITAPRLGGRGLQMPELPGRAQCARLLGLPEPTTTYWAESNRN